MSYYLESAADEPEAALDEPAVALDAPEVADNPEGEQGDAGAAKPYYY